MYCQNEHNYSSLSLLKNENQKYPPLWYSHSMHQNLTINYWKVVFGIVCGNVQYVNHWLVKRTTQLKLVFCVFVVNVFVQLC